MIIRRDKYLNELIGWKHTDLIKIITGIRRCGKSFLLLTLFHQHLLETDTDESHIIEIALDDISNELLRDPFQMIKYVKERIKDREQYYLIIDEVQLLDRFVDVLNSFMHIPNVDVYVTGVEVWRFTYIRFRLPSYMQQKVVTSMRYGSDIIRMEAFRIWRYWVMMLKERNI